MEIGSKLRNARNNNKLTQEQAAEALGVSRQTISNWENNKSYPDIISVIKMSDLYSVSLDHLLKEEKSMKQTYQEFLDESTNIVKAKRKLEKILLFTAYFLIWAIVMIFFWQATGPVISQCDIALKYILLPLSLLISAIFIGKNNYFGKWNWLCVLLGAVTYLAVPYASYSSQGESTSITFMFPNFNYMVIGIIVAACGIFIGSMANKFSRKAENNY